MPKAQYLGGMLSNMKLKVSGMKKPDAKPPKNCIVSKVGKFGEKGVNKEMSANAMDAPINIRRGPNVAPIQMAGTVMSIWAAVCAVVIHAPSSNPAPTAPRMSARPKVDNRPFRVDMNVPMSTARSPSHGMVVGGEGSVGASMRNRVGAQPRSFSRTIPGVDLGFDRHPGHQAIGEAIRIIYDDFHRNALHDLGEVAGGVVRGSSENTAPDAGANASTCPRSVCPGKVSTVISAFCPTLM